MQKTSHDVVVLGGGPGGSTVASYLAKSGIDVALVESKEFPRFQIGESLLPYSMEVFEDIGFSEKLKKENKFIKKFGAEMIDFSNDQSIRFDFTLGGKAKWPMAYEVERSVFDHDLLEHAKELGARVYQPVFAQEVTFESEKVTLHTNELDIEAKYLVDASGRSSFLGRKLDLRRSNPSFNNVGVFAHYEGIERKEGALEGDITIGILNNKIWIWMIPFKGDTYSIGVVCSSEEFKKHKSHEGLIESVFSQSDELHARLKRGRRITEPRVESNYSQYCEKFVGDRWLMLGDSAEFLDPIFSSGVHISVTSAKFASKLLQESLSGDKLLTHNEADKLYTSEIKKGIDRFVNLLKLFYGAEFVPQMNKVYKSPQMFEPFTMAVAGGVWDDDNPLYRLGVL